MSEMSGRTRRTEFGAGVVAGLFLVMAVMYLIATITSNRPFASVVYPLACVIVLLVLLVLELATIFLGKQSLPPAGESVHSSGPTDSLLNAEADEDQAATKWRTFLLVLLVTVLFAFVATQIDYVVGTAAFMVIAMLLINKDKVSVKACVIAAIAAPITVHFLFVMVLQLSLPSFIPGL